MDKKKSTAMPEFDSIGSHRKNGSKDVARLANKEIVLKLEDTARPKTRTQMYKELEEEAKEKYQGDIFEIPTLPERAIAFFIDAVLAFFVIKFSIFISPVVFKVYQLILFKMKFESPISLELINQIISCFNIFLGLFIFIVCPVTLTNNGLGKKIMKLNVRGVENFSLGFGQVILRELIAKPLGVILLIGLIMPFFDKKLKKSFHDRLAGTFVIKE